jgi:hypothetical protein
MGPCLFFILTQVWANNEEKGPTRKPAFFVGCLPLYYAFIGNSRVKPNRKAGISGNIG